MDFFEYRETLISEGFKNSFAKSVWKEDPTKKEKTTAGRISYGQDDLYTMKGLGDDYAEEQDLEAKEGLDYMMDMYKLSKKKGPVYKGKFENMKSPVSVEISYLSTQTVEDELGTFDLSDQQTDYPGAKLFFFAFGKGKNEIFTRIGTHRGVVHDRDAEAMTKGLERHVYKYGKVKPNW